MRRARVSYEIEAARLEVFRDFRSTKAGLLDGIRLAERAELQARSARRSSEASARAAIADAHAELRDALRLERVTSLHPPERSRLQQARLSLREASVLLHSGRYAEARDRAAVAEHGIKEALAPVRTRAGRFHDEASLKAWRKALADGRSWSRSTGKPVVLVLKAQKRLDLIETGRLARSYVIDLGSSGTSDKLRAGDQATPEGRYRVVAKRDLGASQFHRALLIDYPNEEDQRRFREARRRGALPEGARIGGQIAIHGEGGRGRNWTQGCVALSNPDMDDLFARVTVGTPVTIVGSDGSSGLLPPTPEAGPPQGTLQ